MSGGLGLRSSCAVYSGAGSGASSGGGGGGCRVPEGGGLRVGMIWWISDDDDEVNEVDEVDEAGDGDREGTWVVLGPP